MPEDLWQLCTELGCKVCLAISPACRCAPARNEAGGMPLAPRFAAVLTLAGADAAEATATCPALPAALRKVSPFSISRYADCAEPHVWLASVLRAFQAVCCKA